MHGTVNTLEAETAACDDKAEDAQEEVLCHKVHKKKLAADGSDAAATAAAAVTSFCVNSNAESGLEPVRARWGVEMSIHCATSATAS